MSGSNKEAYKVRQSSARLCKLLIMSAYIRNLLNLLDTERRGVNQGNAGHGWLGIMGPT